MTDLAQQNLREPERVEWDTAFSGSTYTPPPPAIGPDGQPIVYSGKIVAVKESPGKGLDEGYLNYEIDIALPNLDRPLKTWASTRTFAKRNEDGEFVPLKGNPNALGKVLKSAGLQFKPQTNSDYRAAMKSITGKMVPFTLDWVARSKDGSEQVKGYEIFPDDPENPGRKKSILKAGDILANESIVSSEVLFANARVKNFLNPANKVSR